MSQRSLPQRLWYELIKRMLHLIFVALYRVRYTGRHNIPLSGGVLVVSNHQSHFDPPMIGVACPSRMNYLARDTLFRFSLFGRLLNSIHAIPIDREGLGLGGIKESLRRLKRGEMVLIFPEGTRTADGEISAFRPGFTSLAVRSHAAILPVAIEGAFDVWPRWRKFPGLGKIRVHYGPPILPEQFAGLDERELVRQVEQRVRQCQAVLRERWDEGGRCNCRR